MPSRHGQGGNEPNDRLAAGKDREPETENSVLRARIDELLEQITKQSGLLSEQSSRLSEQSVQLGELLGEIRLLRKSLERSEKREAKYKRELPKLQSQLSYARNDRYDD